MPDTGLPRDEFKRKFAEAIAARDAGDPLAAVRQLESLLARSERTATLTGTIGTMLFADMNAPERAIPYLQWTVIAAPRSKLASLTLCRALSATGQEQRATDEARRYLAVEDSEEHRKFLASRSGAARLDERVPVAPQLPVAPRLPVVLLIETAQIADAYARINAGQVKLRNRLRGAAGLLDRLDFYVATFAGRVWSLGPLDANAEASGGINLEKHGLVSALAEVADRLQHDGAHGAKRLPAWLIMLTAGEIDSDAGDIAAELKSILKPLRDDPGLKLLRVLIGSDSRNDALRSLTGADAFRLREAEIDAFFGWLARNLEAALRASGTGASVRLTPPDWSVAA